MYVILLLAGILQAVTISLNAQLGTYYSMLGVTFFSHSIPMALLLLYLLLIRRKALRVTGAPWYVYCVGFMGILLTVMTARCALWLGAAVATALSTAGQLVMSAFVDHYGLFGMKRIRMSLKQIPGYALVLVGAVLVLL